MVIKRYWIFTILITALIMSLLIAGCGRQESARQSSGDQEDLFTIRIPTQTSFNEFYVAEDLGYFKEEGIKIKYIGVLKAGEDIAATLTNSNDVFTGHVNTVSKAILAGAKVTIVAPGMVDNPKFPHMMYLVRQDSPLKGPEDLRKQKVKIAVGNLNGCADLIFYEYLSQNNIPLQQIEFVTMPDKQQEQALQQGLIDIAVLHPPWGAKALSDGGVRNLVTSWDIVHSPGAGASIRGFSNKFISEHPEVVTGFTRAIVRAHKYINTHQQESVKMVAKRLNMPPDKLAPFWYDESEIIQASYIQWWLDAAARHGQIPQGSLKPSDIYTNRLNPYFKP